MDYTRQFGGGEIDRNLPGLRIAYPLFDCLVCLYANATKQSPHHIQCAQLPGFEMVIHDETVAAKTVSDIKRYRMDVSYGLLTVGCPGDAMGASDDFDGHPATIVYDRTFANGHGHDDGGRERLPITINTKWWMIAREQYTSELASSCGCCA